MRLFAQFGPQARHAFGDAANGAVACLSTWRQSQLAALEWRDVDMKARTVTARGETTKNGRPHRIPLTGELWEIFERAAKRRRHHENPTLTSTHPSGLGRLALRTGDTRASVDAVTVGSGGNSDRGVDLTPYVFTYNGAPIQLRGGTSPARRAWAKACEEAGFPGRTLHCLRRSGIRNMIQVGGMDPMTAMEWSGHKDASMLRRYNIITTEGMRSAMERTIERLEARPKSVPQKLVRMKEGR